ncbi:ornithine carbamoyltransferase [Peptococcaceae bacterium SCADC1_2_3]|nr:ornithine carbamoyltransferase [Peptococcaceae bacterium SCADC1_2_3]KFI34570.1 ornithine carbamoyltransferase [Peptococcaceae bacterium SCADC1_2_3]KFI37125.1 ornithine carbamoyltransferase [Peptococcaceae bacterium SCADC1_2_3]KFI37247.1 ornithine carbamoyltransferase [Peptococcaceae bacterium SCADC1_2_3]
MTPEPVKSLKGRDLLSLTEFTSAEIKCLLDLAAELKQRQKRGESQASTLTGKTLGMIFQKASTRTRVSFEVATYQLGGYALYLNANDLQLGRGETIADTARVLSRYLDGLVIRTYAQEDVEELALYANIPVINGLSDLYHPCQVLADLQTIREHKGDLEGLKLAYVGDGNNVCHSLLIAAAKLDLLFFVATPEEYPPAEKVIALAGQIARQTGSQIEILNSPVEAVANADVIITDVWTSMGQEASSKQRRKAFAPYQVNAELVKHARPDFIFLHCLPAHRGEEVTADIIDGPHAVVWDEAENRLHVQKAILSLIL